jgi:hypothetical protein
LVAPLLIFVDHKMDVPAPTILQEIKVCPFLALKSGLIVHRPILFLVCTVPMALHCDMRKLLLPKPSAPPAQVAP